MNTNLLEGCEGRGDGLCGRVLLRAELRGLRGVVDRVRVGLLRVEALLVLEVGFLRGLLEEGGALVFKVFKLDLGLFTVDRFPRVVGLVRGLLTVPLVIEVLLLLVAMLFLLGAADKLVLLLLVDWLVLLR